MSAPIAKSQMAFDLPKLSYIDTSWEEPAVASVPSADETRGPAAWLVARLAAVRAWHARGRAYAELDALSDVELADIGLNRGDTRRVVDNRYNQDLMMRAHGF